MTEDTGRRTPESLASPASSSPSPPTYPMIPIFLHSTIAVTPRPCRTPGSAVRNKANWPRMGRNRRGRAGVVSGTVAGTCCTNKANFPAQTEMGAGREDRRRYCRRGRACETKPIGASGAAWGLLRRVRHPFVQTKPISGLRPCRWPAASSAAPVCTNKANFQRAGLRRALRPQTSHSKLPTGRRKPCPNGDFDTADPA